jgi:hypothetical protein
LSFLCSGIFRAKEESISLSSIPLLDRGDGSLVVKGCGNRVWAERLIKLQEDQRVKISSAS